jgi:hypothetical protein
MKKPHHFEQKVASIEIISLFINALHRAWRCADRGGTTNAILST